MLGKLIKFDIKNLGGNLVPMYLCLAAIAFIDRIIQILKDTEFLSSIPAFGYIANTTHILVPIGIIFLFVWLLISGIHYFRNNIMKDQGYLMHTLPVTSYQLVASKVIVVFFYLLLTTLVSYLILGIAVGKVFWHQKIYTDILYFLGKSNAITLCCLLGSYFLVYYMYLILAAYLSFSLAYSILDRYRSLITGVVFVLLYSLGKCGELALLIILNVTGMINMNMNIEQIGKPEILSLCIPILVIYLLLSVLCYFITGRWLQKRLNID